MIIYEGKSYHPMSYAYMLFRVIQLTISFDKKNCLATPTCLSQVFERAFFAVKNSHNLLPSIGNVWDCLMYNDGDVSHRGTGRVT